MKHAIKNIVLVILGMVLALAGVFAYIIYQGVTVDVHDAYAVWWVAGMVIEHMEDNDGRWPAGWDDLAKDYETEVTKTGNRPWSFAELRGRVEVDWNADPVVLSRVIDHGQDVPFRVIWLKDGKSIYWSGREPNRMVLDYLNERKQKSQTPATVPATAPATSRASDGI